MNKYHFPFITHARLLNFSLYNATSNDISIAFKRGVFCLAGANGLGKSTFISSLNYALTGIVVNPNVKYQDYSQYHKDNTKYSNSYFDGRITEANREVASIQVSMTIGDYEYFIERALFEPGQLRELSITQSSTDEAIKIEEGDGFDLNAQYESYICQHVGINLFDQFSFIQHFILTFDEKRTLLLWNERELNASILLAFGIDANKADEATILKRQAEKCDSRARNYKWQSTEAMKDADALALRLEAGTDDKTTKETWENLNSDLENCQKQAHAIKDKLDDALFKLADAVSEESQLRNIYDETYKKCFTGSSSIANHPLILNMLQSGECAICKSNEENTLDHINGHISSHTCPLCLKKQQQEESEAISKKLRDIDSKLNNAINQKEVLHKRSERLKAELVAIQSTLNECRISLKNFQDNHDYVPVNDDESDLVKVINDLRGRAAELQEKTNRERAKRKELLRKLRVIQKETEQLYLQSQDTFLPMFESLANEFLGLDMEIRIETRRHNLKLLIDINNQTRQSDQELSESQRFFLDIAFRMALANFMSAPRIDASLFIDTPEGSLDIAYEARAGDMFAKYVSENHHIIMTANINTSQLLINLALKCRAENMELCRMTDWSELSEVQKAEEHRFELAYTQIEKALNAE